MLLCNTAVTIHLSQLSPLHLTSCPYNSTIINITFLSAFTTHYPIRHHHSAPDPSPFIYIIRHSLNTSAVTTLHHFFTSTFTITLLFTIGRHCSSSASSPQRPSPPRQLYHSHRQLCQYCIHLSFLSSLFCLRCRQQGGEETQRVV
ncbi:hypothetical protein E2C01_031452 [Portunus trituberculatus]|uniref:Uncharacterized protein n=1 Tax=Portunus trituberculatus TaxID=210409 RepID=A0A5B7EXN5_PORTR|nr:hypothetical protein [Portunus trituberculatus]